MVKYAHEHYYDGLYQFRYDTLEEAIEALDRLHRRDTCTIVEVEE